MTPCLLGYEFLNGEVHFAYCSSDGNEIADMLTAHYGKIGSVMKLVDKGDIFVLGKTVADTQFHSDDPDYDGGLLPKRTAGSIEEFVADWSRGGVPIYLYRDNRWVEIEPVLKPAQQKIRKVRVEC